MSLSRVRLFCDPMDCSLPDFFFHGIFQAGVLEWVAISYSKVIGSEGLKMLRGLSWKAQL